MAADLRAEERKERKRRAPPCCPLLVLWRGTHNLFTPGFSLLLADTAGVTGALRGDCPQPVLRVPFRWGGKPPHSGSSGQPAAEVNPTRS